VEKALHSFKMGGDQVMKAVPMLSDAELAQLSAYIDSAQTDFAADALDNEHITYIIIALAAAVIVLVPRLEPPELAVDSAVGEAWSKRGR
jgi:hypothetical protein